jgi:hypothetical protein
MLPRWSLFVFSASLVALAGCGGGGGKGPIPSLPAVVPSPSASSAAPATKTSASFVITIPKATPTPLAARRPAYVSPATQSMTVSVTQGSTSVISQTVGLTATSSGCSSSLANVTCTLTLSLAAGKYSASITTYDGANGTGNQLSTAQNVSFTVVANQNNIVPLSLSGIPMNIVALAASTASSVYVVAEDADGNFIVGSGAPTFTAAKASGSAVATITQPSSTAPNTISFSAASPAVYGTETIGVTASYPSSQTNACATTGAVCTLAMPITAVNTDGTAFLANYDYNNIIGYSLPLSNNTATPAYTLSGANYYPYWGIAINSAGTVFGWGYESTPTLVVSSPPYTTVTTDTNLGFYEAYYYGAADSKGDVFIPNFATVGNGAIGIVSPPYTGAATQLTAGVDEPYGAAVDSGNNLYVANEGNDTITVYASPYTSASATVTTTSAPYGVVIAGSKLFVTEDNYIDVFNLPVTSSSTPAATLTMTGYSYGAAALDPSGNLWVGCYESCASSSSGAVYEFTTPFVTGHSPVVSLTSLTDGSATICTYVTGIGFDGSGNLYVDAGYGGTVDGCLLQYTGTITSTSTPTYYVNSGPMEYPWGMVMAPPTFSVTP